MERRVYWHTHGGNATDAEFASRSIGQLIGHLRSALPDATLIAGVLPNDLAEEIDFHLGCGFIAGAMSAIEKCRGADVRVGLCVYCPDPSCAAAEAARRRLEHAFWGISFGGVLSLTYVRDNPYALWHETLHLLGAQDHYDLKSFRPTCDLPSCVMQFAPDERTVGAGAFLCPATVEILRRTCGA